MASAQASAVSLLRYNCTTLSRGILSVVAATPPASSMRQPFPPFGGSAGYLKSIE